MCRRHLYNEEVDKKDRQGEKGCLFYKAGGAAEAR